jgi:hypothetical protein
MLKWLTGIIGTAVVAIVIVIIIDLAKTPRDTCQLIERTLLRDICQGGCAASGGICTATKTRAYFGFGEQAAACQCISVTPVTPSRTP